MSKKKVLFISIAVFLILLIPLGLHRQGSSHISPLGSDNIFPLGSNYISPHEKWVANDIINDIWGKYIELQNFEDTFWYRLNFAFPEQEIGNQPLKSLYLIGELSPNIVILNQKPIRIYTIEDSIDVTEYFEIITTFTSEEYTAIETIMIVALDTALNNAQFYGNKGELYVVFEVKIRQAQYDSEYDDPQFPVPEEELMLDTELQTPIEMPVPLPEEGAFDPPGREVSEEFGWFYDDCFFVMLSRFQMVGEFFNGERFNITSNNVYTYIYQPYRFR